VGHCVASHDPASGTLLLHLISIHLTPTPNGSLERREVVRSWRIPAAPSPSHPGPDSFDQSRRCSTWSLPASARAADFLFALLFAIDAVRDRHGAVRAKRSADAEALFSKETTMRTPARASQTRRVHLAIRRGFLVEALPAPLRKSDLLEALSHADVLEDSSLRGKARSRLARGRLDIEGGILPTSEELDIAELIIEMVETRTQAKGDSLVQIRQDTTRAIYHARYGMQELCSREASERAPAC
jgi:hypothetical protein